MSDVEKQPVVIADKMDNLLDIKSIGLLLDYEFKIPAYQRGYRWEKSQVKALLNDIWDYEIDYSNPETFYCLQPVVVKEYTAKAFELIDGQQRLTTILLIFHYLNETEFKTPKKHYSLIFETRIAQADFLSIISDQEKCSHNIDLFHLHQAYKNIEHWFIEKEKENASVKGDFYSKLVNRTKVIWYNIKDDSTLIDIFTRLNMGKIPLTNAELIKALFLKSSNFKNKIADEIRLKQLQIATEWDRIEYTLQNQAFWYFIYNNANKYDTRIEYIFDLIKEKESDEEKYFTFYKFNEEFEESKKNNVNPDIDAIWLHIKKYFLTFEEWFTDRELYHLVGYLVATGCPIKELKAHSEKKSKTEFKSYLKQKIQPLVACDIKALEYKNPFVKPVLLLFNIQTILANKKSNIRFPFDKFKTENWDIEHIRSQTDKTISGGFRKEWAKDILGYLTGKQELEECKEKIESLGNIEKEFANELVTIIEAEKIIDSDFDALFKKLQQYFNEDKEPENINSIANLALLDATTNRSYKNAYFPIKRRIILENDMKGTFIPICTKNVFLKSYSTKIGQMMHWEKDDATDYLNEIIKTLAIYKLQS